MKRKTTSRKGKEKARKVEKPPEKLVTPSSSHQQDDSMVGDETSHALQNSTNILGNTSPTRQDQQSAAAEDGSEYNIDGKGYIPWAVNNLSRDIYMYS